MQIFTTIADLISYRLLGLQSETRLGEAVHFFIEDVTKIYVLLTIMIYIISFLRAGLDTDRIRKFLSGKHRLAGYALASGFGAITPFCSCSSIPLFLGFTSARIPLGITMAFLITSPMINEVAILLLGSLFGIKFLLIYVITGLSAGILGGIFIDLIGAEKYLMPIGHKAVSMGETGREIPTESIEHRRLTMGERHRFAIHEFKTIFLRVWLWVILGVGIGSFLHGFIPEGYIENMLSGKEWWTVPAAVVVGIPLYSNASGIIPVAQTLLAKGLPMGTTLAFMMSVVAASIPEFTMLRQVMKPRLLLIFFLMLLTFFTLAGWLFNIFM